MSDEAKPALVTTEAAPPVVEAPTSTGPKAGRVVSFVAREKERAAERRSSTSSSPSTDSQDKPSGEGSTENGAAPGPSKAATSAEPTAEAKKPDEPKPHRALTLALEKEAKLVEDQRAFKTERESFEAERTRYKASLDKLQQFADLVNGGKKLQALELIGLKLDDLQDEFLASVQEETPETKAARIVRETLAAERTKEAEAAAEREKTAAKTQSDQLNASIAKWKDDATALFKEKHAEFDAIIAFDCTADQVWQRAEKEFNDTGKLPTHYEALQLLEKDIAARMARSKRFQPVPVVPAKTEEASNAKAGDKSPRTLTSKGAGEVPIVRKKPVASTKKPALERVKEAMRELGVTE